MDTPEGGQLSIRDNGTLSYDGVAIGRIGPDEVVGAGERLFINAGWMKAAGLGLTIEADPQVDRKRGGILLQR